MIALILLACGRPSPPEIDFSDDTDDGSGDPPWWEDVALGADYWVTSDVDADQYAFSEGEGGRVECTSHADDGLEVVSRGPQTIWPILALHVCGASSDAAVWTGRDDPDMLANDACIDPAAVWSAEVQVGQYATAQRVQPRDEGEEAACELQLHVDADGTTALRFDCPHIRDVVDPDGGFERRLSGTIGCIAQPAP